MKLIVKGLGIVIAILLYINVIHPLVFCADELSGNTGEQQTSVDYNLDSEMYWDNYAIEHMTDAQAESAPVEDAAGEYDGQEMIEETAPVTETQPEMIPDYSVEETEAYEETYVPNTEMFSPDNFSPDNSNHLMQEGWIRNGSFMTYNDYAYASSIGVDVSKWNGSIDWYSLSEQGIEFAIIRVGCRGYENGEIILDDYFYENIEGALAAGLQVGVYFYSQAIDEDEAVEEALFVIDCISGYNVTLPVYFDTEEVEVYSGEARTDIMATANYTLNAEAFCSTIESYGYRAGVYASHDWIQRTLDFNRLSCYDIWYAMHADTPGRDYRFDMWQYTAEGNLYGCDTYLDMNIRLIQLY